MIPNKLHFTPELPCIDCKQLTQQGLLYPKNSLTWQILPLCERDIEMSTGAEVASSTAADLQQLVTHHLQRRRRHLAQEYLHLRGRHAHNKARRALRISLNRSYRRQAQMREEGLL